VSEIVDRLRELCTEEDPAAEISVNRDEAMDLIDLIDHLPGAEELG
jgi:hypothetical protein